MSAGRRLGLVVPCRDEADVVERRLADLVRCSWPDGGGLVVVVDDHSDDDTSDRARRVGSQASTEHAVQIVVIANVGAPGKTSAIAAGLRFMDDLPEAERPDLVGISDADVVLEPDALLLIVERFDLTPRLGMACGAQHFVDRLAHDGCVPPDARDTAGRYDRLTAWVRRLESRFGSLFSVHGQLLVWRRELALRPSIGVAADDLDLMLRVRSAGWRVELVREAVFHEVKTPAGPRAAAQASRRARAYFDALELAARRQADATDESASRGGCPLGPGPVRRVHWWCYRRLPALVSALWLPALVLFALVVGVASWTVAGPVGPLLVVAAILLVAFPLRDLAALMAIVRSAARDSRRARGASSSDRWEMPREPALDDASERTTRPR